MRAIGPEEDSWTTGWPAGAAGENGVKGSDLPGSRLGYQHHPRIHFFFIERAQRTHPGRISKGSVSGEGRASGQEIGLDGNRQSTQHDGHGFGKSAQTTDVPGGEPGNHRTRTDAAKAPAGRRWSSLTGYKG
ncbi:Uncharacterised protein [Serratia fonticola]|uniref:Uncharacterized protein n=1 Tax=Serratia fonticola TaxID=47917 RepID=A0A4U9UKZ2_SERFO|nr:Uncharacterised protein [Serratia fonticola]